MSISPQSRKPDFDRWPVVALMFGVFCTPYRSGRQIAHHGIVMAMLVHLFALSLTAVVVLAYSVWSEDRTGTGMPEVLHILFQSAALGGIKLTPLVIWLGAAVTELSFFALSVCILVPWMAINGSQFRQIRSGLILGGFSSLWLLPMCIPILLVVWLVQLQNSYLISEGLYWILSMIPVLLLLCIVMTLRFARGYGDSIRTLQSHDYPICEFCGYDLRVTAFEARCPECGEQCEKSFTTIQRVNNWECGLGSYWNTWSEILVRPDNFFHSLRTRSCLEPARRFMRDSCIYSSLILVVVLVLGVMLCPPTASTPIMTVGSWTFSRTFSIVAMWLYIAIGIPLMMATLVHSALRRLQCLQAGVISLKICCYMSAFAIPTAFVMGAFDIMLNYGRRQGLSHMDVSDMMRLPSILVISSLCGWAWMVGRRGVRWMRWSNT